MQTVVAGDEVSLLPLGRVSEFEPRRSGDDVIGCSSGAGFSINAFGPMDVMSIDPGGDLPLVDHGASAPLRVAAFREF